MFIKIKGDHHLVYEGVKHSQTQGMHDNIPAMPAGKILFLVAQQARDAIVKSFSAY